MTDGVEDVRRILTMKDAGFFAYVTENALLKFQYCHVFSLKRPTERDALIADMSSVIQAPAVTSVGKGSSKASSTQTFAAHYVGEVTGSDLARKGKRFTKAPTLEEMIPEMVAIGCADLGKQRDKEASTKNNVREASGVLISKREFQVVHALTQNVHCNVMMTQIHDVRVVDLPAFAKRRHAAKVPTSPGNHKLPVHLKMSEEKRVALMTRVKSGLSMDEAMAEALEAERRLNNDEVNVEEKLVTVFRKDDQLNTIAIDILLCSGGDFAAQKLCSVINTAIKAAKAKLKTGDPFSPTTPLTAQPLNEMCGKYELDRDSMTAVELVGQGEFGAVYLANQAVGTEDIGEDEAANDAASEDGEVELQRAVKTCHPKTTAAGLEDFVAEATLHLELKHKHIANLVGVCMMQKPYLVVLEYVMYGDLKKVLNTLQDKEIILRPHEHNYMVLQIVDALAYISKKKIVHLDLAARNILLHQKACVKIADFGLARHYDKHKKTKEWKDGFNLVGKMKIPFLWCPPECLPRSMWNKKIKSYNPKFNERSDIWAFGVVCWELATYGKQPYGTNKKLLALLQSIDEEHTRLEWPPGTPKDLMDVALRCFHDDPEQRPHFEALKYEFSDRVEPHRKRIRDIGALLNAPLELRLREMSTRATIHRRASIAKLRKHVSIERMPSVDEARSEDDDDLDTEDEEDGGASTPHPEGSSASTASIDSFASTLKSPNAKGLKRRNSLFKKNDWAVGEGGKLQRVVKSIEGQEPQPVPKLAIDEEAFPSAPKSHYSDSSLSTTDGSPVKHRMVRLASTHDSNSDGEEPDPMSRLKIARDDSIRRKMSQDFYSESDSDGDGESHSGASRPSSRAASLVHTTASDEDQGDPNDFSKAAPPHLGAGDEAPRKPRGPSLTLHGVPRGDSSTDLADDYAGAPAQEPARKRSGRRRLSGRRPPSTALDEQSESSLADVDENNQVTAPSIVADPLAQQAKLHRSKRRSSMDEKQKAAAEKFAELAASDYKTVAATPAVVLNAEDPNLSEAGGMQQRSISDAAVDADVAGSSAQTMQRSDSLLDGVDDGMFHNALHSSFKGASIPELSPTAEASDAKPFSSEITTDTDLYNLAEAHGVRESMPQFRDSEVCAWDSVSLSTGKPSAAVANQPSDIPEVPDTVEQQRGRQSDDFTRAADSILTALEPHDAGEAELSPYVPIEASEAWESTVDLNGVPSEPAMQSASAPVSQVGGVPAPATGITQAAATAAATAPDAAPPLVSALPKTDWGDDNRAAENLEPVKAGSSSADSRDAEPTRTAAAAEAPLASVVVVTEDAPDAGEAAKVAPRVAAKPPKTPPAVRARSQTASAAPLSGGASAAGTPGKFDTVRVKPSNSTLAARAAMFEQGAAGGDNATLRIKSPASPRIGARPAVFVQPKDTVREKPATPKVSAKAVFQQFETPDASGARSAAPQSAPGGAGASRMGSRLANSPFLRAQSAEPPGQSSRLVDSRCALNRMHQLWLGAIAVGSLGTWVE